MKASLETAFRDCLVPSQRLGMPNVRLCLKTCGSAAMKEHFQPEAVNEVLKGFALKLTHTHIYALLLNSEVFGDYVSQIWRLGTFSSSIYAAITIALLTALNIIGLQQGKWTQNLLSPAKVLGLLLVVILGLTAILNSAATTPVESASSGTWGLAMVFVLLSYGGWNEAAYISAEIQNHEKPIF